MLRRFYSKKRHPVEYESSSGSENDNECTKTQSVAVDRGQSATGVDKDRVAEGHALLEELLGSSLSAATLKEYKVCKTSKNIIPK